MFAMCEMKTVFLFVVKGKVCDLNLKKFGTASMVLSQLFHK